MARKFRFRLETVQRLREQDRDAQQRAVATALRAVGQVEERIQRLTQQLTESIDRSRGVCDSKRLDMVLVRGLQLYRGWLHRSILESDAELALRKAEWAKRRAKLAEASKRLKVIENLRRRQWTRYRRQLEREERATMDEIAVQMHLRRGAQEVGTR